MNRTLLSAFTGFVAGVLLVLVMARESSDVFLRNRLAVVPHELSAVGIRLFQSGDLKGAQRALRAQAAATILASSESVGAQKWSLTYPMSAWLADAITSGMESSGDTGLAMALATIDAEIAVVMERNGDTTEAEELLERAARSAGADPAALRQAALAALATDK
jgi:hypothetical protein